MRKVERALSVVGIVATIMTLISILISVQDFFDIVEPPVLYYEPVPPLSPAAQRFALSPAGQYISEQAGFHPFWHPLKRSERFPNITERLNIYMGNWYLPPCNGERSNGGIDTIDERISYRYDYSDSSQFPTAVLTRQSSNNNDAMVQEQARFPTEAVGHDRVFAMWENTIWNNNGTAICPPGHQLRKNYCEEMRELTQLVLQLEENNGKNLSQLPPLLGMFGDRHSWSFQIPSFQKARQATTRHGLEYITSKETGLDCNRLETPRQYLMLPDHHHQFLVPSTDNSGIIWPFNYKHHFGTAVFEEVRNFDIPWKDKKHVAVWRGSLTGKGHLPPVDERHPFTTFCENVPRCHLVDNHRNYTILDLGIKPSESNKKKYHIPDDFFKPLMGPRDQLKYKAIIIIEGNDVATGLKWALYSGSVVLMPTPTRTSYAMEEWLEPWVHYVPIKIHRDEIDRNGSPVSDVEEKMQWVLDHDEEARKIAERATLFINDLLFDPDHSQEENRKLKK